MIERRKIGGKERGERVREEEQETLLILSVLDSGMPKSLKKKPHQEQPSPSRTTHWSHCWRWAPCDQVGLRLMSMCPLLCFLFMSLLLAGLYLSSSPSPLYPGSTSYGSLIAPIFIGPCSSCFFISLLLSYSFIPIPFAFCARSPARDASSHGSA